MKITNLKLAQMAKSVLRGNKSYGEHSMTHPIRDWYIGIGFLLTLALGGGWWAVVTYMEYQKISLYEQEVVEQTEVYRETLVMAALAAINERAKQYKEIEGRLLMNSVGEPLPIPPEDTASSTAASTPATINTSETTATTSLELEPGESSSTNQESRGF